MNGPWIYTYDITGRLTTASKNLSGAITSGAMAYDAEGRLRQTVINAPAAAIREDLYDTIDRLSAPKHCNLFAPAQTPPVTRRNTML